MIRPMNYLKGSEISLTARETDWVIWKSYPSELFSCLQVKGLSIGLTAPDLTPKLVPRGTLSLWLDPKTRTKGKNTWPLTTTTQRPQPRTRILESHKLAAWSGHKIPTNPTPLWKALPDKILYIKSVTCLVPCCFSAEQRKSSFCVLPSNSLVWSLLYSVILWYSLASNG